jgi:hypothetical protein
MPSYWSISMSDLQRHGDLARRYGAAPRVPVSEIAGLIDEEIMAKVGAGVGVVIALVLVGLAAFDMMSWAVALVGGAVVVGLLAWLGFRSDKRATAEGQKGFERGKLTHMLVVSGQPCLVEEPGSWSPAILVGSVHESFLVRVDHLPELAAKVVAAASDASSSEPPARRRRRELHRRSRDQVVGADRLRTPGGRRGWQRAPKRPLSLRRSINFARCSRGTD